MQTQTAANSAHGTTAQTSRFGWVKLSALGGTISVLAFAIPMLVDGFEPFFAVMIATVLVGLILLRFARKTAIAWLGVVSLALLIMNGPFIPETLMHPESTLDFVPVSMFTLGALLAVIATVPAFKVARGHESSSGFPKVAAGAAVLLIAAATAGSLVARGQVTSDARAAGSTPVSMEDFEFGPKTITAQSGEVNLFVTNNDAARHTFTVDELGIDVSIAPGQARLITFDAEQGEYRLYCAPHEGGMEGELVIQ